MGSITEFAAISTKIKALYKKMLSKEQYNKLLNTKNFVDAINYLKTDTYYSEALSDYNSETLTRSELERALKKHYINDVCRLKHYIIGGYRKLFNVLLLRFQVENIKTILRGKYVNKDKSEISNFIITNCCANDIDYRDLINANDFDEVIEKLKGTIYYEYLVPLIGNIKSNGLFKVETALDLCYFSFVKNYAKKLDVENRTVVQTFNNSYADLLNIQRIFRGKKYYNLSPEELFNYSIYDGHKISKDLLKTLCYSRDLDEFFNLLRNTPYSKLFEENQDKDYLMEVEMLDYLKKLCLNYKSRNSMNLSGVIAYVELSLIEMRNIVSIIESKKYNQTPSEIMQYINISI